MPTSAARASTTSPWARGVRRPCANFSSRAASSRSACARSPTARSGQSLCATTYRAGHITGARSPCSTRAPERAKYGGRGTTGAFGRRLCFGASGGNSSLAVRSESDSDRIGALCAFYSITSLARVSSIGGTSRPSARAVIRFTTRSNLVGCSTGMSPDLAPRRILSTNSAARCQSFGKLAP